MLQQRVAIPATKGIFIVGWTGMRGVVALAAALSLPVALANGKPFPQRDVILFLTFCVIFVTLVLQGLTLPALIRRLGLNQLPLAKCEELEARRIMIDAALGKLGEIPDLKDPNMSEIYEDVTNHYRLRRTALDGAEGRDGVERSDPNDRFELITRRLRDVERATAVQLRDQDRISDEVLRGLLRELDLLDARN